MDTSSYLLGLGTLPALAATLYALLWGYVAVARWLGPRGWSWELKIDRKPNEISDWTLRRDIWFERQRGPIFTGHWCRESLPNEKWVVTRWVGIGRREGRSLMVYKKRTDVPRGA